MTVRIPMQDVLDCVWGDLRHLFAQHGVPMSGTFYPELRDDLVYMRSDDPETGDIIVSWTSK